MTSTRQLALRFISGKFQGSEYALSDSGEMLVGRSGDVQIVLSEDMVSRRHASIGLNGDEISIADVGSTNGTFVNGEKIKKARLKEGDRILIGTSIIKLVSVDPASQVSEAEAKNQLEKRGQQSSMKTTSTSRAMSGSIEEIPLPDLLQLLSTSKRTGVLSLRGPTGNGQIFLRKGQIYYATVDDSYDMNPRKAAYRLLTWDRGTFELDSAEEKTFLDEVKDSTEGLLMEGMRLLDEFKRVEDDLPARTAQLIIPQPLTAPLTALKPEQLEIFQIVLNGGNLQAVLDRSKLSDADAAVALIELIKKDYIAPR